MSTEGWGKVRRPARAGASADRQRAQVEHWASPQAVAQYSEARWLFRGERLALTGCFSTGLARRRVLELGCGGGRVTRFLRDLGAEVVAIDISPNMIRAAQERVPGVDFRVGTAERLEFDDATFDLVVFAFNGLDCLYPKEYRLQAIQEAWRVLRSGGRFVFSHHNCEAVMFGWYRFLRPRKLVYRARLILSGRVFEGDWYEPDVDTPDIVLYYAWPEVVIADLRDAGFELVSMHPNSPLLGVLQRRLHTDWFTRRADPWPYYTFSKGTPHAAPG